MEQELTAGPDDDGRRLDRILRRVFPDMPLSLIHRLLRKGRVTVDGVRGNAATRVVWGARILVKGEAEKRAGTGESAGPAGKPVLPEGFSRGLDILWEGAGLLVVNKSAGLAVHGVDERGRTSGNRPVCLDAIVQDYLRGRLAPSLSFRPGPLHRLDQVSSGAIAFSTSLAGARAFSAIMRERRLRKTYVALADGLIEREEVWEDVLFRDKSRGKTLVLSGRDEEDAGLLARPAETRVFPLAARRPYSLVALEITTGRTHQIRAQAAFHGHPLAGDRKYGGSFQHGGPLLHAFSLVFPDEGPAPEELRGKTIRAPFPESFLRRIREIFA
jgi:23S rRNA pseudouridine955/2504/2580 synthase